MSQLSFRRPRQTPLVGAPALRRSRRPPPALALATTPPSEFPACNGLHATPACTAQVMLSLLLNMLLLGGSILYLSMAGGGAALLLNGSSQRQHRRSPSAAGFAACERPELDTEKLEEWGCKVFNKAW